MTPILFVDHATALGGAERSLLLLMTHLDQKRWQPHLAGMPGDLLAAAAAVNISTHPLFLPRLRRSPRFLQNWYQGAQAVARTARNLNARIIHSNTVRASLYAAWGARLAQRPFIWHMRDFWLSEAPPTYPWVDTLGKRLLCSLATRVVTNSAAVAACLPCRAQVIHNGIDLSHFNPTADGKTFRREHGIAADTKLIGMMGRLRPWKGQLRFLRVAARVRAHLPNTKFVLIGGSPFNVTDDYPQQVATLCRQLSLEDHVIFTGHIHDVERPLAALDLFVHPGSPEPFGLVNIEAMAMGKPVVSFAHGALPEIITHSQTGLLVTPNDETAMVQSIVNLLQDEPERLRLGAAARQRAARYYSIDRVATEISKVWEEVLHD